MLHSVIEFFDFYWKAETKFRVHSPFVYDLVQSIFSKNDLDYKEIEILRKNLKRDSRVIEIQDFGAGSKKYQSTNKRSVSSIAKTAVSGPIKCQLLAKIVRHFQPNSILELGTSLGISTAYIMQTMPSAKITTIEGSGEISKIAKELWSKLNLKNIDLEVGNIDAIMPQMVKQREQFDLIFVDGNHTQEATLAYFEYILNMTDETGIVVFDDIYWSPGMSRAWQTIKAHSRVTKTIDLFTFGIVFFASEFVHKEHHRIIDSKYKPFQLGFLR